MKIVVFNILLLFSGVLLAQNDTLIVANNYKFKVGFKGLIEHGMYSIPSESNIQTDISVNDNLYNFGIQGIYKIGNSKSSIESGIYYLSRVFYYEFMLPTPPSSEFFVDFFSRKTYNNLHIPINYRLDTRIIYFTFGLYVDYLLNTKTESPELFNNINFQKDRKFNLGVNGSLGFEKAISTQFSCYMEVEFSSNLTSLYQESVFFYFKDQNSHKLANYGFAFGINYKILKH